MLSGLYIFHGNINRTFNLGLKIKTAMRVKMQTKKDIKYPINYKVNKYSCDLNGQRIGTKVQYSYTETVKDENENRKFLQGFDGDNCYEIIIL